MDGYKCPECEAPLSIGLRPFQYADQNDLTRKHTTPDRWACIGCGGIFSEKQLEENLKRSRNNSNAVIDRRMTASRQRVTASL